MTELRITVTNTSPTGGVALTPTYFGFHDGSFDLFDVGDVASPGLESLAEDGAAATLAQERLAVSPDSQGIVVAGAAGPIDTQEVATAIIDVDGSQNRFASYGAMILPSNDAFIGTDEAVELFDSSGNFLGASRSVFEGTDVYDAGTEVNTEEDAAFINQTAPNTGVDENGTVQLHPGFNGSDGNPGGTQNILGGTNAFGNFIDPIAADFTLPGAQIAVVHINTVVTTDLTAGRDVFFGGDDDDIVTGGEGRDFLFGNNGYDDLFGGEGRDFLAGGNGADLLDGGEARDLLFGGAGNDRIFGGEGNDRALGGSGDDTIEGGGGRDRIYGEDGNDVLDGGEERDVLFGGADNDALSGGGARDFLFGGSGDDVLNGGEGNDRLEGGSGSDTFLFAAGDGRDTVQDFDADADVIVLGGTDITDLAGLEDVSRDRGNSVIIDLGADRIVLRDTSFEELTETNFLFV
ncbi:MAG: spondin domain-containing protein [Pseudomonadota bacterium]